MKRIKDPVYGYIEINESFFRVIDSIYFQRLRNIIQTSYSSLYPSSMHNRFSHSLGVYWLGQLAFDSLVVNSYELLRDLSEDAVDEIKKTFGLACLCHDIGHSPFSHTGEKFYDRKNISNQLKKKINDSEYNKDLADNIVGKEHEIMSALWALNVFDKIIGTSNFSFFARCIIGLKYSSNHNLIYNACIELLNSKIIDVDKLDYLIRDSYMSGYMSVSIDYERLLRGVYISDLAENGIGFHKSAISVLEAVLTAYDMERRWIQGHHTILYEDFLLKTIIRELEGKYNKKTKKLFSLEALGCCDVKLGGGESVRLLSDADITHLAKKNYDESDAVKEYFDRSKRRHAIWKSEAEFRSLFDFNHSRFEKFKNIIVSWEKKLLDGDYGVYSLCDAFLKKLQIELGEAQDNYESTPDDSKKKTFASRVDRLNEEIKLLSEIKTHIESQGIEFDLVIITQQQFKRSINKREFKNLHIRFEYGENEQTLDKVTTIELDTQNDDSTFFYIFYKRVDEKTKINVQQFSDMLSRAAVL